MSYPLAERLQGRYMYGNPLARVTLVLGQPYLHAL